MADDPEKELLFQRLSSLSPGDRSVLDYALAHPETQADMMTVSGSPNHALWTAFVARGWMTGEVRDMGLKPQPGVVPLQFFEFRLTPEGRRDIVLLLTEFDRR